MVHTGYDTSVGIIETTCYVKSRELNFPFYKSRSLPMYECGALVVAWTQNEVTI